MFRSDLFRLSVTSVLLAAIVFVSVAAVAADDSGAKWLVKPASAPLALGGTADDGYGQSLNPPKASSAGVASDWFERHPESIYSAGAIFASDWFERHPDSIRSSGAAAASDWFERHPESIYVGSAAGAKYYGPPGR